VDADVDDLRLCRPVPSGGELLLVRGDGWVVLRDLRRGPFELDGLLVCRVESETGQRLCETQAGQRYGRWKVSANTTNTHSPRLAGVQFLRQARLSGWRYSDGSDGPPGGGRFVSETYPYATLVGAAELRYDTERPRYKRKPPRLRAIQWRTERAANCDMLIGRLGHLADADPPLLLQSHSVTKDLAEEPSPVSDAAYKHREDLIDALLCAWTASLRARHGFERCQVLGPPATPTGGPAATMIVPARPEQRRQPLPESALPAADADDFTPKRRCINIRVGCWRVGR
jgi:predicted RNase H-like nuclease